MEELLEPGTARIVADPALTAETANRMLELSLDAGEQGRAVLSQLDVGDPAYGDLAAAAAFAEAHRQGAADTAYTWELLGQAMEGDADRLYQVAFAQTEADRTAADRSRGAGGR